MKTMKVKDTLALEYSNSIGIRKEHELVKRDQTRKIKERDYIQHKLKQIENPVKDYP